MRSRPAGAAALHVGRLQQLVASWTMAAAVVMGAAVFGIGEAKRIATGETNSLHYAVREEIAVGSPVADIVNDAGLHTYGLDVSSDNTAFNSM